MFGRAVHLHMWTKRRLSFSPKSYLLSFKGTHSNVRTYSGTPSINDPDLVPESHIGDDTVSHVIDIPSSIGHFGGFTPVGIAENILGIFHYNLGLPWWVSIISLGCVIKLASFPFFLQAQKSSALSQLYKSELTAWNEKMKDLYLKKQQSAYLIEKKALGKFKLEKGFPSTISSLVGSGALIILSVTAFLAVQKLCSNNSIVSVTKEKLGWIFLTQPDPTLLLPFLSTFLLMCNISVSFLTSGNTILHSLPVGMRFLLYALTFSSILVTKEINAGVMLYFTTANAITLLQSILVRISYVRTCLNIPSLDSIKQASVAFSSYLKTPTSFAKSFRQNYKLFRREDTISTHQKPPPKRIFNLKKLPHPTHNGLNYE